MPTAGEVKKALAAAASMAALLAAQGLLDGHAENIITGVIAAANVGVVYWLRNDDSAGEHVGRHEAGRSGTYSTAAGATVNVDYGGHVRRLP
jgi:hypothetical protein